MKLELKDINKACIEVLESQDISDETKAVIEECCRRIANQKINGQQYYSRKLRRINQRYNDNRIDIIMDQKRYYAEHIEERRKYGIEYNRKRRAKKKETENEKL